jgi:hypothetical protein
VAAQTLAEPSFRARRDFGRDVQRFPENLVVGDFNGDSIPDVAVVNTGSSSVTVLIGLGDGGFRFQGSIFQYSIPNGPSGITSGDFNGDGLVDLAISTRQDGSVAFLKGIGQGEFVRGTSVPVGVDPDCLVAGDFNGDQILDLAVCNGDFAGVISVLLGNGDGTFQAPRSIPVGFFPSSLIVADFNGDGVADLAAIVAGPQSGITILLGHGDGSFAVAGLLDPLIVHLSLAVADFNGDGVPDLVSTLRNGVEVFLGNGDGTFADPITRDLSTNPNSVAAADLDGDGFPDVAITNTIRASGTAEQSTTVTVLRGNGDGTFGEERSFQVGSNPFAIVIRDLNGDTKPDLVVSNSASSTISSLINASK